MFMIQKYTEDGNVFKIKHFTDISAEDVRSDVQVQRFRTTR